MAESLNLEVEVVSSSAGFQNIMLKLLDLRGRITMKIPYLCQMTNSAN